MNNFEPVSSPAKGPLAPRPNAGEPLSEDEIRRIDLVLESCIAYLCQRRPRCYDPCWLTVLMQAHVYVAFGMTRDSWAGRTEMCCNRMVLSLHAHRLQPSSPEEVAACDYSFERCTRSTYAMCEVGRG
jgi:hypothetical protein